MAESSVEVAVVGGGPAGLAAALALARGGFEVAVLAPGVAGPPDRRTAALFAGSVDLLRGLGVWPEIERASAPVDGIRIVDDTGGLLRAPEVAFLASDVGLAELGWNVPNTVLTSVLREAVAAAAGVRFVDSSVTRAEPGGSSVRLALEDGGTIEARLVVAADGRRSVCRAGAGIAARTWTYEQSALACSFAHERPHGGVSTEFHRKAGPLTTVPLAGNRSSLVWVETPAEAARLAALDEAGFRATLGERLHGLLGTIGEVSARGAFPLSGLVADPVAARRVALVGEAAHVIPPIGAQGLNLGLRDGAAIAEVAAAARGAGDDIGGEKALARYVALRRSDIAGRVGAIDALNRSLLSEFLPVHMARGLGLHVLNAIGPLRRALMREGLDPRRAG